jgi:exodeoxyribonuclease-5
MSRLAPTLTAEQADAFAGICDFIDSRDGQYLIGGAAGTGKSTLLHHVARYYPGLLLAAPTNLIARRLHAVTGRPSSTLHKLLYYPVEVIEEVDGEAVTRLEFFSNEKPLAGRIVAVDEASMMSMTIAQDLLDRGARILAFGDQHQLPPVKDKPFLKRPDIVLTEIHRQALHSGVIRQAHEVRKGGRYRDDAEFQTVREGRSALGWADMVIVWKNETRLDVINYVREVVGHAGKPPQVREPLICTVTNHDANILNGQQFTVLRNYRPGSKLLLQGDDGKVVQIEHPFIEGVSKGRPEEHVQLAFGYAVTAHKAQGLEWPRVLIIDDAQLGGVFGRKWRYTAITRAMQEVSIGWKL